MNLFEDRHETTDVFQGHCIDAGRTIVQMFQDISHGLPPAMSTNMFQCSIQSVKKLSKILLEFFTHGLFTQQVREGFKKKESDFITFGSEPPPPRK